ncbi:acyltransferase [Enterorhabdus mucosicola]|uniref:Acyltransferase n=1 Tax=Adlercreutzia mucosicola TaxID=580026 RepID=A0A6N8JLH5_9ACTN|nr:nitrilase-related carbon-nitrogen hydrolase [Adlercreutzia mucosicola]MVX60765.1 acyltransferase [Adlercreutzia mucosicola]
MTESRPVRLALIQFEAELGNPAKNTERACQMIAEAAEAGADLVLLPELFSTGYQLNAIGPILGDLVEPVDGPTVRALQEAARAGGCYVAAGVALTRELTAVPYNSSVFIDREGNLLGTYDKQHLWALERFYFRGGNGGGVFDTDFGRVGVMICYDMGFPETARMLALKGCDLVLCLAAWCKEDMDGWYLNGPSRALENTVYAACVNRYGVEDDLVMPGHSYVSNPRGHIIAELEGETEGVLVADIDLADVAEGRMDGRYPPYLRDRRPELYDDVLLP